MRKILLSSAIVMAMGTASFAGQAAESASLAVTGTITPASCDVSLSTASVNFGTVPASALADTMNYIAASPVQLSVACDAATAVAVQTTDNRSSSAMTLAEMSESLKVDIPGMVDTNIFGLGLDTASSKVGALLVSITDATLNGTSNLNLLSSADKSAWVTHTLSSSSAYSLAKDGYFALGEDSSATSPASVTNATYTLNSSAILKKADQYPSGEQVNIDGNVTFSVVYL